MSFLASALGPDGIPYGALALIAERLAQVLYDIYMDVKQKPGRVPAGFNQALMAFLPKGINITGTSASVTRTADQTRPLTFSNTDFQTCSTTLNNTLKLYLPKITLGI